MEQQKENEEQNEMVDDVLEQEDTQLETAAQEEVQPEIKEAIAEVVKKEKTWKAKNGVITIKELVMQQITKQPVKVEELQNNVWEYFNSRGIKENSRGFGVSEQKVKNEVKAIVFYLKNGLYKGLKKTHKLQENEDGTIILNEIFNPEKVVSIASITQ